MFEGQLLDKQELHVSGMKDSPERRAEELMAADEEGRRKRRRRPLTWSTHTEMT